MTSDTYVILEIFKTLDYAKFIYHIPKKQFLVLQGMMVANLSEESTKSWKCFGL